MVDITSDFLKLCRAMESTKHPANEFGEVYGELPPVAPTMLPGPLWQLQRFYRTLEQMGVTNSGDFRSVSGAQIDLGVTLTPFQARIFRRSQLSIRTNPPELVYGGTFGVMLQCNLYLQGALIPGLNLRNTNLCFGPDQYVYQHLAFSLAVVFESESLLRTCEKEVPAYAPESLPEYRGEVFYFRPEQLQRVELRTDLQIWDA